MSPETLGQVRKLPLNTVEHLPLTQRWATKINSLAGRTSEALKHLAEKMADAPGSAEDALKQSGQLFRTIVQPIGALSSVAVMPLATFDSPPAIVIPGDGLSTISTEPEQFLGPKTPIPIRTSRPLVPTFTPTPEATPTPIEVKIPILGTDIPKPSVSAQMFTLDADTRFRTMPSTEGNTPVVQAPGTKYIETGHTRPMSDGTWKEVFARGQVLFVRADVVNSQPTKLSFPDRLAYAN
ncbi:MAG: hypothetical protein O3B87_04275, partial [bacterium]|nr:hypothetical protein [bacterium]